MTKKAVSHAVTGRTLRANVVVTAHAPKVYAGRSRKQQKWIRIMDSELIPIYRVARLLKVDIRWLAKETKAGRIPHLKTGKKNLYNLDAVRNALVKQAGVIPKVGIIFRGGL